MATHSIGAALVTGAGKRVGRALALSLAKAGYDLYLHCHRSESEAQALAGEIATLDRRAIMVQADLGVADQAAGLIAACTALGQVTCLVNNAAVYEKDAVTDLTAARLDRAYAVNLRAPILLAQAFAAQAGAEGLIVNLTDFHTEALTPNFFSYGLAKAGLAAATEMLAIALGPTIRVNAIAPGLVLPSPTETGERFERLRGETLLQRGPDVADIVTAFEYLLGAKAVTGQTLYVDGGQRLISKRKLHV